LRHNDFRRGTQAAWRGAYDEDGEHTLRQREIDMASILVIDDESGIRDFLSDALTDAGHELAQAADAEQGLRQLADRPFDLAIVDLNMPGELGGLDVLRRARAEWPATQFIVLTAHGTVETAVEAMRLGAFDFLQKPMEGPVELRRLVSRALNWRGHVARHREAAEVQGELPPVEAIAPEPTEPHGESMLRRFLWELKRRHVYNVSVAYAAVCFIVLQAAELVLPALPIPTWSYTALVAMAMGGFPVAVVLGWVYDLTATGWRRSDPLPAGAHSR
jgi:CheY-like chemotaxis protein